jgi:hypothetical protein
MVRVDRPRAPVPRCHVPELRRNRRTPIHVLLKTPVDESFRMEKDRTLSNDWMVRHENRLYQVKRDYAPARSKVTVCEWEDGRLEIRHRGKRLGYAEIAQPPAKVAGTAGGVHGHHRPKPPQADHPWRQAYQEMRSRSRRSEGTFSGCQRTGTLLSEVTPGTFLKRLDIPMPARLTLARKHRTLQVSAQNYSPDATLGSVCPSIFSRARLPEGSASRPVDTSL